MPLVGQYATEIKTTVSGYINDTNYNDEFARLEKVLKSIEKGLAENDAEKAKE